jgi:hypothetical protein
MKCSIPYILISFLTLLPGNYNISAQQPIKIKRITDQVKFDGIPDENFWNTLDTFSMTMWRPAFGTKPTESSDIRIGYDDEYLWVAARMYMRDASKIFVPTMKRDETLWDYDAFGIIIDSYNDNENGSAFFTNPAGLRSDFSISNDGSFAAGTMPTNSSWDTFWDVKTSRDNKGWYLEMRIPFSSLKFKTENGLATMGIILNRSISSNSETDLYPAIDVKYGYSAFIKPSGAQKIIIEGARPKKPLYISPYVIGGFSRENVLNASETEYEQKDKPTLEAGIDAKYNINSNLTLDLTANTDFAQVEADDQQVNLTRFSLFFPEKRKFFQERSGLFDFSLGGMNNLFYSRNIGIDNGNPVRIYGGARLTGRLGKWDLGMLDMQTEEYGETPGYNFGVLRMRRQVINETSFAGGIFTSRLGMNGDYNLVYGLDGVFKLFGDDYVNLKWAQTYDNHTESKAASMDPSFLLINWERRSQRGLGYSFEYSYSGKEFDPGIGFILRHGVHGANGNILYGWFPGEKSKFRNYSINISSTLFKRVDDGKLESLIVNPSFDFATKNGIIGSAELLYQKEGVAYDFNLSDSVKILSGEYSFLTSQFSFRTLPSRKVSFNSTFNAGQFYDGTRAGFTAGPVLNLSAHLNLELSYGFDAIRFPDRESNNSLDIHIFNLRTLYMLNTKLSASILIQYVNTRDDLITNFRIRYNPREGNDFYLVYNDYRGIESSDAVPREPAYFNKTVIIKYVHTFTLD